MSLVVRILILVLGIMGRFVNIEIISFIIYTLINIH